MCINTSFIPENVMIKHDKIKCDATSVICKENANAYVRSHTYAHFCGVAMAIKK